MGTRLGDLKSKLRHSVEYFFRRKTASKFPEEIDYVKVFKNHAALMAAYGTVLKRDEKAFDMFFRSLFVQSHIYKKLKNLKKIYLVEIATLYNSNKNTTKLSLNKLVEDADKLSSSLFHFPTIGWKDILLYILPTIAVSLAVVNHLVGLFPKSWSHGVNAGAIQILLLALGLTFTILFLILYPLSAALSFLDKRRFFMFPEYRALRFFDRLKKRFEAFLGRAIEETIYEKENQLFHSLGMGKEPEPPIDIYLFSAILIGLISMLEFVVLLTLNQFWLVIVFIPFFFLLGRRAM